MDRWHDHPRCAEAADRGTPAFRYAAVNAGEQGLRNPKTGKAVVPPAAKGGMRASCNLRHTLGRIEVSNREDEPTPPPNADDRPSVPTGELDDEFDLDQEAFDDFVLDDASALDTTFPVVRWRATVRVAHAGFALFGMVLTGLVTISAFIMIMESPRTPRRAMVVWAVCTAIEAIHLLLLVRKTKRQSLTSWILFFVALSAMVWNTWSMLGDPDSRFLFSMTASLAAFWLGSMWLISLGGGDFLSRRPWLALLVAAFAWIPLAIIATSCVLAIPAVYRASTRVGP